MLVCAARTAHRTYGRTEAGTHRGSSLSTIAFKQHRTPSFVPHRHRNCLRLFQRNVPSPFSADHAEMELRLSDAVVVCTGCPAAPPFEAMVFPPANVTSWMRKRPSSYPIRVRLFALCVSALAVECCSTARRLVAVRRKHEAPRSVETLSHYNARCGLLLVTVKSPSH
jgi:hypothetical protein